MASMLDYLAWRGDLPFAWVPVSDVDELIFSTLAYVSFDNIVPTQIGAAVTLASAASSILSAEKPETLVRTRQDLELLRVLADCPRYRDIHLTNYRNILIPQEETQFAAITFLLPSGQAVLAFRGTDNTLVGWREDFNMTFRDQIPAQLLALEDTTAFAAAYSDAFRLLGHSKGGNLAVYAAAKAPPAVQKRILEVCNHDGPGFSQAMMADAGYQAILPKVRTYAPQSSVFGMLLEHQEEYTIVKSNQVGLLQHDPYTWEVLGPEFVTLKQRTDDSLFLDSTFRTWLAGMSLEQRDLFFDAVFDLLETGGVQSAREILRPQNIVNYLKALHADGAKRDLIGGELLNLLQSAKNVFTDVP